MSVIGISSLTTAEFLSHLRSLNVELRADGERLRCNGPNEALTPELLAELKERKEYLIAFLHANGDTAAPVGETALRPVARNADAIPLSFAQQRLWFFNQFEPNNTVYNDHIVLRLTGHLNLDALEKTLAGIVARHEVLRTTFVAVDGAPVQVIADGRSPELKVIDLESIPAAARDAEVLRVLSEENARPIDLTADLMLRPLLLKLGPDEHILALTIHHIASDGWSMEVFFQEFAVFYEAFCTGRPPALPDLPIQYADFAIWQRRLLQGDVLDSHLKYWKKQLAGAPALMELPTDRPRPPEQSYRGAKRPLRLSKAFADELAQFSRREGATLFMTLLTAFYVLLHRYNGQDDIVVGCPTAGRSRVETEKLIGCFINNLVLRADLSGDPSYRELLRQVRQTSLEAMAHQDLPFEKLVEELQPRRALDHHPIYQVMFVLQNVPRSRARLPGLTVVPVRLDSGIARFDLSLCMGQPADDSEAWVGSIESNTLEYNTDLFDPATIERMDGHFQTLLREIVADPARPISQLPILTEAERHQLLVDWNNTAQDYSKEKCFHDLFEAQAQRTPDSIAVVFDDRRLTYRELNARANRLAHYLRRLGVGPETLVGVFVERSIEMVVALLGVMKAGGAYVPLDPTYPQDRLAFMLEDAGLALLVTQPQLLDRLPQHKARVVCLDADQKEFAQESAENPRHSSNPANLAYVIYTSGSTGKPKGVQIPHRALVNFLESMRQRPGITDKDVLLAVTTLSFDIAGLELYLPLAAGARVVIVGRETLTNGGELAETIRGSGATIMQATPATWRLLLESGWQGEKRLKILCGGEGWPPELADALLSRCGSLWNMYGPTETTIWSAVHPVDSADRAIPVGRPIANTRIYIVDRYGQPVPIGIAGELLIGGDGLARGYLGRLDLTAEKFIPDPFSGDSEARLYRTGDLARYLPDGNIELLGRIDHQVKVRGYRIELGEIESVLADHPAVREVVVVVREDVPGDKRLVGYIVSAQNPNPTTTELRTFLQQKLPEYMVPGAFVFMDTLPLTPNRKVDRRALPPPDTMRPELESAFVAPETGVEKVVAEIWAGALGLKRIGIHDNFFDLGGHSLLLAKVHGQLQTALRRDVPMIELFRYPTISTLAKYLSDTPEQQLSSETSDRAEKQRSAIYNRRRAQAAAEGRGHQE